MRFAAILVRLAVWLCPALLAGCAIAPGPVRTCGFTRYALDVEDPVSSGLALAPAGGPLSFGDLIDATMMAPPAIPAATDRTRQPPDRAMLFLSGGSLHGAFGAGWLAAWRENAPGRRLPDFAVVTGISTGAILATFAFLDRTDLALAGYTIDHERDLLKPLVPVKGGEPTTLGYIKLLRRGALGDLAPLRARLGRFIDGDALVAVAREAARGRRLLVGVVDVDTGRAVVLDLGDMATRYAAAAPPERTRLHDCYIEAVIASSSAPLAARPVFIDNRMYVDGGARFGMFSDEIGARIEQDAAARSRCGGTRPRFFLIINGDQAIGARCGKADPDAYCRDGDPPGNLAGAHEAWRFDKLALRSESILANQVYRFSADRVQRQARDRGYPFHVAKIDPQALPRHAFRIDDPALGPAATKTCGEWHDEDRRVDNPLQFYPRYMRCVIDYGRAAEQAEAIPWHSLPAGE